MLASMRERAGELLERYEAIGDEDALVEAQRLYEQALAEGPDPELLRDYGYLLECHGRRAIGEGGGAVRARHRARPRRR
jgi:hypothetical protein